MKYILSMLIVFSCTVSISIAQTNDCISFNGQDIDKRDE